MANLINEAKRMQHLAGVSLQEGYKFDDANEEVAQDLRAKLKSAIESTLKSQLMGALNKIPELKQAGAANIGLAVGLVAFDIVNNLTESQLNEILPKDIKIGELYIASMPTSNDGKERVDVKVKVVGPAKELSDTHFVVEPIENKRYTNPVSKGENEFSKGKQYNVEAMYLKPATQAESLDIEEVVNEALKAIRK